MWLATHDLPGSAAHPFYARLNQILDQHDFDGYVEGLCQRFYADNGRPGLLPGRCFRLLLIGYFEGLDAERAIAWRAADSFALREFLGLVLPEAPPDHSTISRTRRLIDLETHEAVFTWMRQRLADVGVTVQDANDGDTETSIETLIEAAEQIETVQPDGHGLQEVVGDRGVPESSTTFGLYRRPGSTPLTACASLDSGIYRQAHRFPQTGFYQGLLDDPERPFRGFGSAPLEPVDALVHQIQFDSITSRCRECRQLQNDVGAGAWPDIVGKIGAREITCDQFTLSGAQLGAKPDQAPPVTGSGWELTR